MKLGKIVALGVAAAIGTCAAVIAWKQVQPVYTSEGLVRIAYQLPVLRYTTDQNAPLPQFDTFMQSQVTLVSSSRVVNLAMTDATWKAYHITPPANGMEYFSSHMKAQVRPGSELIQIMVSDHDPATATAAVTAIINAYQEIYTQAENGSSRRRLNSLEDDERVIESQLKDLSKQRDDYISFYGSADLTMFFDAAVQRMLKMQEAVDELKLVQAAAGTKSPTAEQIAVRNPAMRDYLDARDQRRDELRRLEAQFPDDNPQVKAARQILADADAKVESITAAFPKNLATLESVLEKLQQAVKEIGIRKIEIERLDKEFAGLQQQRQEVNDRIKTLVTEGSSGGRLSVISTGELPLAPAYDPRARAAAVAGGVGFLLPLGLSGLVARKRGNRRQAA